MKSEVWRISEKSPPRMSPTTGAPTHEPDHPCTDRALRWQAPELMADSDGEFLAPMDVYAFGICCVEILTKGSLPWPLLDDKAVRYLVLRSSASTLLLAFTNLPSSTIRRGEQKTGYPEQSPVDEGARQNHCNVLAATALFSSEFFRSRCRSRGHREEV